MAAPRKIFVFDRKELLVLSLLSVTVAFFSFTMGVHLGKTVSPATGAGLDGHASGLPTEEDPLPNRQEFVERGKAIDQEADSALSRSLHDEIEKTGIKLEVARQVDLPDDPKAPAAGGTTLRERAQIARKEDLKTAVEGVPAEGRFTLQVGSYPSMEEAQKMLERLEGQGIPVSLKAADIKSLGRRYRIFLGRYESRDSAAAAGDDFKARKMIDAYVVLNRAE